jgi:hypothetical protein
MDASKTVRTPGELEYELPVGLQSITSLCIAAAITSDDTARIREPRTSDNEAPPYLRMSGGEQIGRTSDAVQRHSGGQPVAAMRNWRTSGGPDRDCRDDELEDERQRQGEDRRGGVRRLRRPGGRASAMI